MVLYIRFLRETHGNSSRPVAYLEGARQERKQETAEGEEDNRTTVLIIRP